MSDKQDLLFEVPANWQTEWEGMPEFVQEKKSEFSKIIIRFENEQDLKAFALLIGQKLTPPPANAPRRFCARLDFGLTNNA